MTIIADRGLFIRILTASGKVGMSEAETYADALDGATKDPATKSDLAELRAEVALLSQRLDGRIEAMDKRLDARLETMSNRLDARIDTAGDKQLLRFGAFLVACLGLLFAALRYSLH